MSWLFAAGLVTGTLTHYCHQTNASGNYADEVVPPAAKVSVIIPSYDEEILIERTLQDIYDQNIVQAYPEAFEIIVAVDGGTTDNTATVAAQYAEVIHAPRGKLNVKNYAAQVARGDILVFLDADSVVPPNFLNLLLRHFWKPDVVGVGGSIHDENGSLIKTAWLSQVNYINRMLHLYLLGGVAAVRKDAYFAAGGHDETINQFQRAEIVREEEVNFLSRLKELGSVIIDDEATIFASNRGDWCREHGNECDNTHPQCQYCEYCHAIEAGQRF